MFNGMLDECPKHIVAQYWGNDETEHGQHCWHSLKKDSWAHSVYETDICCYCGMTVESQYNLAADPSHGTYNPTKVKHLVDRKVI